MKYFPACVGKARKSRANINTEGKLIFDIDIFVNCNWVHSRWQQYSTHLHTNSTQNNIKQTIHRTTQQYGRVGTCPVLASYTPAFALQLRKKYGKT